MRLHDLKPRPGAKHRRKRLGQGESSGHGKTSGRGGKGQTARSGSSIRIGFEGGQMPLIRRIPKRGFNNSRFAIRYVPVNLEALNRFEDGATVDAATLRTLGLANGPVTRVKILGDGELTRKLSVRAHAFSASARAKIEKLGGTCQLIDPPPAPAPVAKPAGKGAGKPPGKPADGASDKPSDKQASKPSAKPSDKPAKQAGKAAGKVADKPADGEQAGKPAEKPSDKPADKAPEKSA
jgi:large subunit ribosomal protein L15